MPEKYDVIIIGAGIGGLTAAAILARKGKKVLVLEKNPVPGGYGVNFKRGDFEFDAVVHLVNSCSKGGLTYGILEKSGIANKVKFLKHNFLYRSLYPDFDISVPQNNVNEYKDLLFRYFPREKNGINKLFDSMSNIYKQIQKLFKSNASLVQSFLSLPFYYPHLFKYSTKTYQQMLDSFINDFRLKAIISQLWPYFGLPPSKLSTFYFAYPWHDYFYYGGFYPEGGGQAIANALVNVIKENGGNILLNTEVEKIAIENKCAKGVFEKNGGYISSSNIISNISAKKTFFQLVGTEQLPEHFCKKVSKLEFSISAFMVYLGLNMDLREKGVNDYELFVNPNYDLDDQFRKSIDNDMEKSMFAITFYSNLDKTCAPTGKSVIGITVLAGYDFWVNLPRNEYLSKKEECSRILIKRAENIIPNLSSFIKVKEVATPLTMERYTGNPNGAIYGWSQIVSQSGFRRMGVSTPTDNLFLASAWTRPGGGFCAVMQAGEQAAGIILKKRKQK